jgi:hypothetical protein
MAVGGDLESAHAPIPHDIANRLIAYNLGVGLNVHDLGRACTFFSRFPAAVGRILKSYMRR